MNGPTDGCMDGWMDGWMVGWVKRVSYKYNFVVNFHPQNQNPQKWVPFTFTRISNYLWKHFIILQCVCTHITQFNPPNSLL